MTDRPRSLALELLLLLLLAVLWGSSYLWVKIAVDTIPPLTLIASRVAIAAIVLLGVVAWYGHRLPRAASTWRQLFIQAFLNSTGAWTILAWGQQFVDSGLAGVLNSTSPIFVLLLTAFWTRHEPVSWARAAGVLLGLGGIVLIIGFDTLNGLGQQVVAQLAILAGAMMYACAAIYGKSRFSDLDPTAIAAGTMICASLCLVPASLAVDRPWQLAPPAHALAAAAMLGVFCTGLAMLLYFRLLRTLGSMGVASQGYLRAGLSVLLGIVILGEQPSVVVACGLVGTMLGVALINMPIRPKRQRPTR